MSDLEEAIGGYDTAVRGMELKQTKEDILGSW